MAYSYVLLPGDGSNTFFSFSFPFLDRAHVTAEVNGVSTPFTWLTDGSINISPAPAAGTVVRIKRNTPKDELLVDFSDGSVLKEGDLDLSNRFNLYCAQEAQDSVDASVTQDASGVFDGQGRSTTNFADPTDPTGLVTRNYFETVYTPQLESLVSDATEMATNAANSASSAQGYATLADDSADLAASLLGSFRGVYLGSHATAPGLDGNGNALTLGDLYLDTSDPASQILKVYTAVGWKNAGATVEATLSAPSAPIIVTSGHTSGGVTTIPVPSGYDAGLIIAFVNGTKIDSPDVDASSGTSLVFNPALAVGDEVNWVAFGSFDVANVYTKPEVDLKVANATPAEGSVTDTKVASSSKLKNRIDLLPNAKDFGVIGDGLTDDTSAMQAFLTAIAGKAGRIPAGTYVCTTLVISSGTTLFGEGIGSTRIKAKATLAGSAPLLRNSTQTGTLNTYYDTAVTIEGIDFDGGGLGSRTAELLSFIKMRRLEIRACRVRNIQYMGVAIAGSREVLVRDSEFTACGNTSVTAEGGAAIWLGASGDGSYNLDVRIVGNFFHDNEWSGIYGNNTTGLAISNNQFTANKESSIFCNNTTSRLVVSNNTIRGTTKKNISGSGVEIGSSYVSITGNVIDATASDGISLTDTQHVTVSANVISNPRADAGFTTASCVAIYTTNPSGTQPKYITIEANGFLGLANSPYAAVNIAGAGAAITDTLVIANNASGSSWSSGKPIKVQAGKLGSGCATRGNLGAADNDPFVGNFITNAGIGAQAITGLGFKPRRVELLATVTNTARISQCNSVIGADGIAVYHTVASTTAGSYGYSSAGRVSACLLVIDQAGTTKVGANFTSFDDDGFTINITTAAEQAYVRYVAHP